MVVSGNITVPVICMVAGILHVIIITMNLRFFLVCILCLAGFFSTSSFVKAINFSGVSISPTNFMQGQVSNIILSGSFTGSDYEDNCIPNIDQVPRDSHPMNLVNINYSVLSTSISGTIPEFNGWRVNEFGQDMLCDGSPQYMPHRYEFMDFPISVSGLGPGTYQLNLNGVERIEHFFHRETGSNFIERNFGQSPSSLTFTITAPAAESGTIEVRSNRATGWVVSGPDNFSTTYSTTADYSARVGNYTIRADDQACYAKTITANPSNGSLTSGGILRYDITYTYNCGGGGENEPPPPPPPPPGHSKADIKANGKDDIASIEKGTSATISWTSENVFECSITKDNSPTGWNSTSGSQSTGVINQTGNYLYHIGCSSPNGTVSDSVTVNVIEKEKPPPPDDPPTCSSSYPQSPTTSQTSGTFYLYAKGVKNATSVYFPTWSDVNGQDDIVWYPATNMGDGEWRASVDMARHRSGNPDYGTFSSHVYMNNSGNTNVFCGTANFSRVISDTPPDGVLDVANCSIFGGWAYDPDTSSSEIAVHFYKDGPAGIGTFLTSAITSGYREDVNRAKGITGNHGFTIFTPAELFDGRSHPIYAYGINTNPSGNHTLLINSPKTVNCPAPTPAADIKADGSDGPITISYGGSANISWGSANVSSCTVTPGGWTGLSGSKSTGPLTQTTTYTLSCTGSWGPATDSVTVNVSSQTYTLTVNSTGASGVAITSSTGHGGTTNYSRTNLASGTSVELTAPQNSGSSRFTSWSGDCDTTTNGGRTCNLTINNVNKTVTANYTASAPFDYSLSNSGETRVIKTSGNAYTQNTITKTLRTGSTQPVQLSLTGVPNGTSYSINQSSCSPTCTSTIIFTVGPSTPANTYQITVTGTPLNRTTQFNLVVIGAPFTVSCTGTPASVLVGNNVRWQATVAGGRPPLIYSWSGTDIPTNPAPSSNPYNRSYSTIGRKVARVTVTDADSISQTCDAEVQVNFNPNLKEF